VDAVIGPRFDLAMERFRSGKAFEFREVAFRIDRSGVVFCVVESSWQAENITPATATRDLDEAETVFRFLARESPEFKAAVGDRPLAYELVEDYGMGTILICSRRDGLLEWSHGFPRSAS
jgi:hypothetical protein